MSIRLYGPWKKGFAYDIHTLDSVYLGVDESGRDRWSNTRSEMGELVYVLKYRGDKSVVPRIVDLLSRFKGIETMDFIIPIPPSDDQRPFQPVFEVANELSKRRGVPVLTGALSMKPGEPELKNIDDPHEREAVLKRVITLSKENNLKERNVLLLDDVFRSGATLTAATDLLHAQGRVRNVYVLTLTKTRSTR